MRGTEPETDCKKENVTPILTRGKEEAAGDCRLVSSQEDYGANPPGSHIQHVKEKKVMGSSPIGISRANFDRPKLLLSTVRSLRSRGSCWRFQ